MIDFMVVALPRSGTTWASAWLTTDAVHCVHDPLCAVHYEDWDEQISVPGRINGISCTGIWMWPRWLERHPARKVVLIRDFTEIQGSLEEIGLPVLPEDAPLRLSQISGMHVPYKNLFDPEQAKLIWEYLTQTSFNAARHRELVNIEMQPMFAGLSINRSVTRRLLDEMRAA